MYRFTPPTVRRRVTLDHRDFLWSRVSVEVGLAVVQTTAGGFRQEEVYDPNATDVAQVWLGGRTHEISDADAAALTAAGYGACLTVIA